MIYASNVDTVKRISVDVRGITVLDKTVLV